VVNLKAFETLDKAAQAAVLKAAASAGERGWKISDQKDDEYLKELVAKGMMVDRSSAKLKAEMKAIGERMTADWLKQAGAEGQAVLDAYRK
jgi:TRAP-type C4-dicarboxylate transport system substrate-binding protein